MILKLPVAPAPLLEALRGLGVHRTGSLPLSHQAPSPRLLGHHCCLKHTRSLLHTNSLLKSQGCFSFFLNWIKVVVAAAFVFWCTSPRRHLILSFPQFLASPSHLHFISELPLWNILLLSTFQPWRNGKEDMKEQFDTACQINETVTSVDYYPRFEGLGKRRGVRRRRRPNVSFWATEMVGLTAWVWNSPRWNSVQEL